PSTLRFVYYDLPPAALRLKRLPYGNHVYYHYWQIGALSLVRQLHKEVNFDIGHHVTFARYWSPSFLAHLDIPFVWGPVGGGESSPLPLLNELNARSRFEEHLRVYARLLGEKAPSVRATARSSWL